MSDCLQVYARLSNNLIIVIDHDPDPDPDQVTVLETAYAQSNAE